MTLFARKSRIAAAIIVGLGLAFAVTDAAAPSSRLSQENAGHQLDRHALDTDPENGAVARLVLPSKPAFRKS